MKKSLSLLLAIALVFSMFSSLALAADELTVEQKYEALKAEGIFSGMGDGSAGLDQKMTRAQFARIAGLLAGLDVDATPSTKTFSDVADNHWAIEEIEAAAAAGLVEGMGDGTFNPSGNVTIQQLAVVAAKILKLDPVEGAEVEGAAAWAAPYIQALLDAGVDFPTNYTEDALRADLVNVSYEVAERTGVVAPEQVSVVSAKPVGVQKVEVQLNKAVDTEKAQFSLKKGAVTVALGDVEWSADKKVATLPLKDVKITEGTYTVTLSGLAAETVDKATAEFTAENETVSKIEFVTASDEIAYTAKAKVKVRAENQYGELASFPASNYSVFTGYTGLGERVFKDNEGYLVIELNTNHSSITRNVSQIPLTIYYNETRVSATKTFKVGNDPFVTKIELGEVEYSGNKTYLSNVGETATIPVYLYDQYGNPVTKDQGVTVGTNFNEIILPQPSKLTAATDDFNDDNYYETRVTLNEKEPKPVKYTVTIYAGGSSASATVEVGSSKIVTSLAFGEFDDVLAEGDTKEHFVTIIGYDADGNQLTADELVDPVNYSRINITVSGPVTSDARLIQVGPNKGKVRISAVNPNSARSSAFITASISEIDAQDFKTLSITIQPKREPERLVVTESAKQKAVLGANSDFKIQVRDQYGKEFKNLAGHQIKVTLTELEGNSGITVTGKDSNAGIVGTLANGGEVVYNAGDEEEFHQGFTFNTVANRYGKVQFKAELIKNATATTPETTLSTVTQSIESINPYLVDLTYSLADIGELYAALDSNLLPTGDDVSNSNLAKTIQVSVKDPAGIEVAFPDDKVHSLSASNHSAVVYEKVGNQYKILGNKAGTSTVTGTVYSAKHEIVHISGSVTVKSDQIEVAEISAGNGDKNLNGHAADGTTAGRYKAETLMDLKVVDNYGIEYKGENIDKYKRLIGITYSITGVKGGGTVSLDSNNELIISGTVTEFLLTAHAPNGKSASTLVYYQ